MKLIYFALLLIGTYAASAQEIADAGTTTSTTNFSFKLYPNPVYDPVVYITTPKNDPKDIIVYDVFGEIVLTDRIFTNALNISKLVPGVYVIQVTENSTSTTRKLVVK
ncbi:T9SS type A sorting domain-containing protein [Arenibacter sp. GZD96]|uniref:T9SS type A sorting domain-containing protein n=1 Tax=Aurantibrevibacter litoralis TaxID=3106030 RepID=UPI002AFF57CA|nr:T9SS type A sorting domain-containing protein [Arenibacter sp. GZD-96]MEA1787154.1 T9SS type A sorting domain-containing protein [Arenibacter sp. GZD-96]